MHSALAYRDTAAAALDEALPELVVRKTQLNLSGELDHTCELMLLGWQREENARGRPTHSVTMSASITVHYDGSEEAYLAREEELTGYVATMEETLHYLAGTSGLMEFEVHCGPELEGVTSAVADIVWKAEI